ncbi:MAG: acetyl-CoA C-acyltransferase, partial [Actinobacteria bacterium]|nr:acetyl-CoA C-acyltransferase [Actinomycetota bacterium]
MSASVIVSAARTAIGRFGGAIAGVPAVDLGARAIRGALEKGGVDGAQIDYVIMGHVIQAGAGQIT